MKNWYVIEVSFIASKTFTQPFQAENDKEAMRVVDELYAEKDNNVVKLSLYILREIANWP